MLQKINEEVYLATSEIVEFDRAAIDLVKTGALSNARRRSRICAHKNPTDSLHEMLIGIAADSYIRPHRHHGKIESFH